MNTSLKMSQLNHFFPTLGLHLSTENSTEETVKSTLHEKTLMQRAANISAETQKHQHLQLCTIEGVL